MKFYGVLKTHNQSYHTLSKILSIFRLPPKHHNTQFLEMIEGYWLSNTKRSQVQVIMKMKDKELKLELHITPLF